jgi:hypothetical protein
MVFPVGADPRLYNEDYRQARTDGVEYLHRDPASRWRRRKGKSFKSETVKYGHETEGIGPKKDCAGEGQ